MNSEMLFHMILRECFTFDFPIALSQIESKLLEFVCLSKNWNLLCRLPMIESVFRMYVRILMSTGFAMQII